ncbi:MAG: DUF4340 domain-containing protein [Gemmataceae bacterium]
MNFKTTYVLFGLLVVMFIVLGIALFLGPTPPAGAGYLFPSMHNAATKIDVDKITRVTIQRKNPIGEDIVLEREAGSSRWRITEPRDLFADDANAANLVLNLHSAKYDTEAKPVSWRTAGLSSPSRIIHLEAGDRLFTLTIGDVTEGEERAVAFVESSERKGEVLVVRKGDIRSAFENLTYFRAKELLPHVSEADRLKLTQGNKSVELSRPLSQWRYVQPPYGEADLGDLLTTLGGLRVAYTSDENNDFVANEVKDLEKYHLDASKAEVLSIEATIKGQKIQTLIGVSKKEGEKYFATTLRDGNTNSFDIVKISAANVERYQKLLEDPASLRDKNLVRLEGSPDAIDVKNAYGLLEFRRLNAERDWELYRGETAAKVDLGEVRKLVDGLMGKNSILSFPDPAKRGELGLDGPNVIEVTLWADSLTAPSTKKDDTKDDKADKDHKDSPKQLKPVFREGVKPVAVLRFGARQGEGVAVERLWGDSKTLVLAPRELLTLVDQRPLDYYDRSVPAFNSGSAEEGVTRIEIQRDGMRYDLKREKEGSWKIQAPNNLKGRTANDEVIRRLLSDLNRIRAKEIVAEQADPKTLASEYNLEKPPVSILVTLSKDGTDTTYRFDFGKARGEKGVYAKFSNSPAIYVVDPEVYAASARDLRDPTVLSFKPEDVEVVCFKGWQKLLGSVTTLTVERKDGSWVAKDKTDFNLDAGKVDELVRGLSRLQAEKFVTSGQGLAFQQGAFEVQLTLKDKKTITLLIGAEEGGAVYAQSSELKGETVLIRTSLFTGPRGAPAYFSKL